MGITMNQFFRLFIFFLAYTTAFALNAAGSSIVHRHTVHFDANGTITRIISPDGQENTPGRLVGIQPNTLRFLSTTTRVFIPGESNPRTINWRAFTQPSNRQPTEHDQELRWDQSSNTPGRNGLFAIEPMIAIEPPPLPTIPTTIAHVQLADNDSSQFIPSASSLVTTLTVLAIFYATKKSETISAIGNGIMDSLPLEKLHTYLEKNAPMLLEKKKITAATLATLAVIIDHFLTTSPKTRFEANMGQAAQLSLCGWATYRTVEKLLTSVNHRA